MSTVIKIDTNALEKLFPEGSEARVQLQGAVMTNFVDRTYKNNAGELAKTFEDAARVVAYHNFEDLLKKELSSSIELKTESNESPVELRRFAQAQMTEVFKERFQRAKSWSFFKELKDSIKRTVLAELHVEDADGLNGVATNARKELDHLIKIMNRNSSKLEEKLGEVEGLVENLQFAVELQGKLKGGKS